MPMFKKLKMVHTYLFDERFCADVCKLVKAKTLYAYQGGNPDELPFSEGEELTVIDRSEGDWWKTERDGMVFIVPSAYLEVVEG